MISWNRQVLLLLLLVAAGCSSGRQSEPDVGPMATDRDVYVENGTTVDLQIAVIVGATRTLVGNVRARGGRTIPLPRGITGSFRLMAEPLSGGGLGSRIVSEPIQVEDSRRVTWEIRPTGIATVTYRRGPLRP